MTRVPPKLIKGRDAWIPAILLAALAACAYGEALLGRVLAGRDVFRLFLPQAAFLEASLRRGELPLWIPHLRLGQPFAATLQSEAFYLPHVFAVLAAGAVRAMTVQHLFHVALALAGTWWLGRRLGMSRAAAAVAAGGVALGPVYACLAATPNLAAGLAWTGPLLLAVRSDRPASGWRAPAWLALAAGGSALTGAPELWVGQVFLALGAAAAWNPRPLQGLRRAGLGLALGAGLAGIALVPAFEFARWSTRGAADDQLWWSLSPTQLVSALWPLADAPRGPYWGGDDQWLLRSVFVGSALSALALAAKWRRRRALPFAAAAAGFALLALGAHFPPAAWALTHGPLAWFRYPAKYFLLTAYCASVLAGLGLDRLAAAARRDRPRAAAIALVLAALFVTLAVGPWLLRLLRAREGMPAGLTWFLLALACLATVRWALPRSSDRGRWAARAYAGIALAELAAANLYLFPQVWLSADRLARPSALAAVLERPVSGRLSVDPQEAHPASDADSSREALARFVEESRDRLVPLRFVEEDLRAFEGYEPPVPRLAEELRALDARGVFDLVGVRFYVRLGPPPFEGLEELARGPRGSPVVYRAPNPMPRAFVVQQARVADEGQTRAALVDPAQPARTTAYLASGEPLDEKECQGSNVRFLRDEARHIELEVDSCGKGVLVVTDAWFPGWTATVDGKPVEILRADLALRAVPVPSGPSRVRMDYLPASFTLGAGVSGLALLALLGLSGARLRKPS